MRGTLDVRQVRVRHTVEVEVPANALRFQDALVLQDVETEREEGVEGRRTSLLKIESPPERMNFVFLGSSALGISSKNRVFADHYPII